MGIELACEALETGCCLELRVGGLHRCVEVHAVGRDSGENPLVYGWQRQSLAPDGWTLIRLDQCRSLSLSGYFAEAPRPGYDPAKLPFDRVVCQL